MLCLWRAAPAPQISARASWVSLYSIYLPFYLFYLPSQPTHSVPDIWPLREAPLSEEHLSRIPLFLSLFSPCAAAIPSVFFLSNEELDWTCRGGRD